MALVLGACTEKIDLNQTKTADDLLDELTERTKGAATLKAIGFLKEK